MKFKRRIFLMILFKGKGSGEKEIKQRQTNKELKTKI